VTGVGLLCLLFASPIFSEDISISVNQRGEGVTFEYFIEFSQNGVISEVSTVNFESKARNVILSVVGDGESYSYRDVSGRLSIEGKLTRENGKIHNNFTIVNVFKKTTSAGVQDVTYDTSQIVSLVNSSLVSIFDLYKGTIFDVDGNKLAYRRGDTIFDDVDGNRIDITRRGKTISLRMADIPEIVQPTTMSFQDRIVANDIEAFSINFVMIPNELRFLLFFLGKNLISPQS